MINKVMKFFSLRRAIEYLGTFPKIISENSTKLLALLISALAGGFLLSVVIPFILLWDVISNGHVVTDLSDMGLFVLCIAGVIFGAGVNIKVPDMPKIENKPPRKREPDQEEDFGGPRPRPRHSRAMQDDEFMNGEDEF